jgi:ubiquitin-conjugating enzyme E2 variant
MRPWGLAPMNFVEPFFAKRTPRELVVMLVCVGANFAVMAFCAGYLLFEYRVSGATWLQIIGAVGIGYFAADFASGFVHWGVDTWFSDRNFGRAIAIAREHHTHPQNILGYSFLEQSTLGSAPSAAFIGPAALFTAWLPVSVATYALTIVWLISSTCLFFGTSFHNLAHQPPKSRIIRFAQKLNLVITPQHHWQHHRDGQLVRYCAVNGWANYICDPLRIWRRLEWLVHALTGAVPRRDDLEWQGRYAETGTLQWYPPRIRKNKA